MALALAVAYASNAPLPYVAPILAFFLTAAPRPPMGFKGLVGLTMLVLVTTGSGLLLIPLLVYYPASALLLVAAGLFFANYLTINLGKGPVGVLLTMGIAMISAAGTLSSALALAVILSLVFSVGIAVACQWLVYPWFPEDPVGGAPPVEAPPTAMQSSWIALRATLIVFPAYLLVLINPTMYLPVIMKSVALGQQSSFMDARNAGRELLGSTFLAGVLAILVWAGLGIATNLWMFFLWILLAGLWLAAKTYGVLASRFPPSYWQNTAVTMLILLGPAVEDSANGKDVYAAFAVRISLFIGVTLYAWGAIIALEYLRDRRQRRCPEYRHATEAP